MEIKEFQRPKTKDAMFTARIREDTKKFIRKNKIDLDMLIDNLRLTLKKEEVKK